MYSFTHLLSALAERFGLSHYQHFLYQACIAWVYQAMYAKVAFAAFRLFRKQVALKSLIPAYFASSCYSERFFST